MDKQAARGCESFSLLMLNSQRHTRATAKYYVRLWKQLHVGEKNSLKGPSYSQHIHKYLDLSVYCRRMHVQNELNIFPLHC